MIGKLIAGRYQVESILGKGGMATVYKAFDQSLERSVAIKIMNPAYFSDQDFVDRFIREAKSTAKLEQSHIMQVYDVGQEDNYHYMVMELLEGGTLKELIQEKGYLAIDQALEILKQVLSGLAKAHQKGIIHRDLKPQNILRNSSGEWKLGDFGIARVLTSDTGLTKTGSVMGSVRYFSPEQARGVPALYSSDLYSLGIVLYEMLTGTVPFDGNEIVAIALQHTQSPVPDPRSRRPDIPESVVRIIYKALEKQPENRFQSATEMMVEVEAAIKSLPNFPPAFPPMTENYAVSSNLSDLSTNGSQPNNDSTIPEQPKKRNIWKGLLFASLVIFSIIGIVSLVTPDRAESDGVSFELTGFFSEKAASNQNDMLKVKQIIKGFKTDKIDWKSETTIEKKLHFDGIEKVVQDDHYTISYRNDSTYYLKDQNRQVNKQKSIYRDTENCYQVGEPNNKWEPVDCITMENENRERLNTKDDFKRVIKQLQKSNLPFTTYEAVYTKSEHLVAEWTVKDLSAIFQMLDPVDTGRILGDNNSPDLYEAGIYQIRLIINDDSEIVRIQRLLKLQAKDPSPQTSNVTYYQTIRLNDSAFDAYSFPE